MSSIDVSCDIGKLYSKINGYLADDEQCQESESAQAGAQS